MEYNILLLLLVENINTAVVAVYGNLSCVIIILFIMYVSFRHTLRMLMLMLVSIISMSPTGVMIIISNAFKFRN